ncbi:acetyl-CoA acetyltransferase [Cupriavidus sp. USMAHM13]|uniref:thiolase family protein n=1 Tax=Cupriavidus sp. USMAHM13 TaxID=1389192 RepID=UPI0008A6E672|nr:thiolase family protein [Cupriavidus sp. USMAHM13]AOY99552.1 acetyl-CoA acetyltransferase [Cupriavidus sp. USMAHM13]
MRHPDVVLCHPVRTPIGAFNGSLKGIPATELGTLAIRAAIERAGLDPARVGTVTFGNVIQAGNRMNPARQAALNAGIPDSVPALTVNRVCGSGAQAIASAADEVRLGYVDIAIAGGMENMDRAPYLLPSGRWGQRMGDSVLHDSVLMDGLVDAFSGQHSGWHTEDLAARYRLDREAQDRWAERSQQAFSRAQAQGRFAAEIVPVPLASKGGTTAFAQDETNRPDTTLAGLARLKPAFRADGTITAGNAPGINSGAAAVIVADRAAAEANGLQPLGRLVAYGLGAVAPGLFGLGPVPAVRQALARADWSLGEVERFEINEAFAAVPLAVAAELGLPHDLINVDGGAIAHGHPIGATGAILATRLLHSMRADGIRRGIVTLCIGGGQGIALALESLG